MRSPLNKIFISRFHLSGISSHLTKCLPEEGCGLLAGQENGVVQEVFYITNKLHTPVRFRMEEKEQVRAFTKMDRSGMSLLAIFHSHPEGPDYPSETDLVEYNYLDALMLIYFRSGNRWRSLAFNIDTQSKSFLPVEIVRIPNHKRSV